ncbi:hypothetical protein BREVNS_0272 [Brevinematales bacterium NS]|nr:hypothetical protein BREVNS_0272 [Brevinematales bacterium NS]
MRPLHGCFLPLFGSGAAPLFPDFSVHKGWFVFFIQKNRFIYYGKEHFDTNFCFFITFLRPLHIRAKVSVCLEVRKVRRGYVFVSAKGDFC